MYFTDQNITQRGNPMELNSESLEMQKQHKTMVGAQRVDEKNGVICLVIMFTARVMTIKMSKMAHFSNIMLMTAQSYSQTAQDI